jgi:excisionase family DNA binding protein
MEAFSTREMAERLNVSPRLVRRLASQGRIYPAKRTRGGWLFYANSTVIRPPERTGRKPQKMTLPFDTLTVEQFKQHARYWLDNTPG